MRMTARLRTQIETAAAAHGLDPDLVQALCEVESSYNPMAYRFEEGFYHRYMRDNPAWQDKPPKRWSASYGLMQILAVVAVELGFKGEPEELYMPEVGLEWGCRKLANLMLWARKTAAITKVSDEAAVSSALAAYNGGRRSNEPDKTVDRNHLYANKVIGRMEQIKLERQFA